MFSFIETKTFSRLVRKCLSDEEYRALQATLIANPKAGPVIPRSGGVRKLRWPAAGRGKRGGYRIIYYPRIAEGVIWMLTLYPKNVRASIPTSVLQALREEIEDG
jgi:mRNA-degrading endonuclease RelE of RelBE toxin-antitoxin system